MSKCRICYQDKEGIHGHHIAPKWAEYAKFNETECAFDKLDNDRPRNKLDICSRCHGRLHALYYKRAVSLILKQNPLFFNECIEALRLKVKVAQGIATG